MLSKLRGYRTLIFSFLLALVPILEMTEMIALVPEKYENLYMVVVAILVATLRYVTVTPMGKNTQE